MAITPATTQTATVVHILNGLAFGGVENLCLQLIQNSPPKVQNILISTDPKRLAMRSLFEQIPNLIILEQPYQGSERLKFVFNLMVKLRELQPNSILIYPFGIHIFVGIAARLAQVPSIATTIQNTLPSDLSIQKKWKTILRISRLLGIPTHPCSHAVQSSLQGLVPLPSGSSIIPNGCDVAAIATQTKTNRQKHSETSPHIIGMVARLNSIKDQATLIRAFRQVHDQISSSQLWLIGDGEEKAKLQNLIQDLNLQEAVILWGDRADIPQLLGQMDIYAFSTTADEGFGIALIEAMAASLPIIASDVPACREVLDQGNAGILVPQGHVAAMAQALKQLLLSPTQQYEWGQRAYQRVVNKYSIQTCATQWYELLLNGAAAS